MPDQKLPDRPVATSADDNDLIHIVDVSDPTDSPEGTSKQITKDNFLSNYLKGNQTITLSGDATGSGTTSIAVTVVDNSHNHTIGNVTGLQTQLNLKANLTAITKALIDSLGVNATTLDGIDSTQFLRSDVDDVMNGNLTVAGTGAFGDNVRILTGVNSFDVSMGVGKDMTSNNTLFTGWRHNSGTPFGFLGLFGGNELRFLANGTLEYNGNLTATGTIQAPLFLEVSDERLKTKIKDLKPNHIPVKWKEFELKSNKGQKRYGVIAQELEITNPELVHTNQEGFKSVNYIDFLCIKSAEQENKIEQLEILVKQLIDKG
jgi:hypothetical protein